MWRKNENIWSALLHPQEASDEFAQRLEKIHSQLLAKGSELRAIRAADRALRCAERKLRRPLRLAIMGESNSGKSALTNLLLGTPILPTLQLPNTRIPSLIRYGRKPSVAAQLRGGETMLLVPNTLLQRDTIFIEVALPIAHLKACEIIDLPGFADPLLAYDIGELDDYGIDASIWCTYSTQAWKESERAIWVSLSEKIRKYGILAVTHMDKLTAVQAEKVMARLRSVALADFKIITALTSPIGLGALNENGAIEDEEAWKTSGAADFHAKFSTLLAELRRERLARAQAFVLNVASQAQERIDRMGKT